MRKKQGGLTPVTSKRDTDGTSAAQGEAREDSSVRAQPGAAALPLVRRVVAQGRAHGSPSSALRALLIVRAAQPISRADLARRMDVHRSTVTEIVGPLLAAGVLREEEPEQESAGRSGRPPIGLSFRARPEVIVGVSLGVQVTQVGAATPDGCLLDRVSFDTPAAPAAALARIHSTVERLRAAIPDRTLRHVGVSVPGPTDAERTRLLYAPHLGWRDVAVAEVLRGAAGEENGVQVTVENDATAAALYEVRCRLRDHPHDAWSDFALVRVGTGIGVGLVQGGEVFRGAGIAGGLAGEFGHMTIVAGGKPCVCGNRGCWERYAAESSAVALYTGERPQAAGAKTHFMEVVGRAAA